MDLCWSKMTILTEGINGWSIRSFFDVWTTIQSNVTKGYISIVISLLGDERAGLCASRAFVCLFCKRQFLLLLGFFGVFFFFFFFGFFFFLFCFVFLFLLVSGIDCSLWLWHSFGFSINMFTVEGSEAEGQSFSHLKINHRYLMNLLYTQTFEEYFTVLSLLSSVIADVYSLVVHFDKLLSGRNRIRKK